MRRFRLLPILFLLLAGCTQHDTEALARIGRRFVENTHKAAGSIQEQVDLPRMPVVAVGLKEKVETRLRWDALLMDAKVEVAVNGAEVDLKGTVKSDAQRRRAAEIAETTVGVQAVNDALKVEE
jgi:hypothetical protein